MRAAFVAAMLLGASTASLGREDTGEHVDFARDVRPILSASCVDCHGPAKQKGGLRLDVASGAQGAIVAGDPAASELVRRVASDDEDERMPQGRAPLTPAEIATLRDWIAQGADWPAEPVEPPVRSTHWSYQPLRRPQPPPVRDERGVRSPIDRFVLARLEAEGLAPAPETDLATLARRVALDLTGLPPTPAEVEALLADPRADAYERYVDRLLATTAWAERRAQTWLDLARYADTNGYEKDDRRVAWRWRDWVIDAFDRNLPFDQFTIEQIAGDLLPGATLEQRIATGFHRNTLVNQEGGTDPEEFRVAAVVDRVNTTATVWLGTTLACAQCHNHKFDPFSQRDYYRFFAYFDSTADTGNSLAPQIPAPSAKQAAELDAVEQRIAVLEARIDAPDAALDAGEAAWCASAARLLAAEPRWRVLRPDVARAEKGSALGILGDGSVLAGGEAPPQDVYVLEGAAPAGAISLVLLEALADASLPAAGPGRIVNGNFVLTDVALEIEERGAWRRVPFAAAEASHEQLRSGSFLARHAIDGDPATGWAIWRDDGTSLPERLVLGVDPPLQVAEGSRWRLRLAFESPYAGHEIGRCRISVASGVERAQLVGLDASALGALRARPSARSAEQRAILTREHRRRATSKGRALAAEVRSLRAGLDAQRSVMPTALVMQELAEPRTTRVLAKGSFLAPGEAVEPGPPAVLPPLARDAPQSRLGLARWLVAPDNPLTPRVLANRAWSELFDRGLVETPDDFGTRGEPPTHPELLDWLASELIATGWDLKRFYRSIATSAAYRRSSRVTADDLARDPQNRLLARQARPRLEVETLRDQALAIAGLLTAEVGGPSVMPPQPDGVWAPVYSGDSWSTATDADRFRRGLYTFWRRGSPYLSFALFDAPSRELACTRRPRATSPLQALVLLDDPAFVECAVALAQRILAESGPHDSARIEHGFLLSTARRPQAEEARVLAQLLADERGRYGADRGAADALLAHARHALREGQPSDPREIAAWTSVAQALLNLDEVVTRN